MASMVAPLGQNYFEKTRLPDPAPRVRGPAGLRSGRRTYGLEPGGFFPPLGHRRKGFGPWPWPDSWPD